MKKIYLSAFVSIFSVGMSVAQVLKRPYSFNDIKIDAVEQTPTDLNFTPKALGVTFWTEDFTGGLGSWGIDNDGQAGGPGQGFFRIVTSAAGARAAINNHQLAVVLGIEHGDLFDCQQYQLLSNH